MKQRKIKHKQKFRSFNRLIGLTLNCGLSAFYYGFCLTYFNSIPFREIVKIYNLESYSRASTEGLLTGCISFTGAIGSMMAIFLVDRYPRRNCLGTMSLLAIILSFLIMVPSLKMLVFVRIMQGLIVGAITCITPLYINQMMPKSVSGPFWSFHQCLYVFGITFSFILVLICKQFTTPEFYWRIVFGFPIVTSAIQIFNFIFVFPYESPKYLVIHGQQDKAHQTLKYLYKQKYVERVFQQIVQAVQYADDQSSEDDNQANFGANSLQIPLRKSNTKPDQIQLKPMTKKIQSKRSLNQTLLEINRRKQQQQKHRSPNNKVAVFTAIYLAIQQPFIGGPSVIQYSGDLIGGVFPRLSSTFPIIINAIGIVGSLLSICVLAKYGRRSIILFGSFSQACCLFLIFALCLSIDYSQPQKASYSVRILISILFICIRIILSTTYAPVSDLYTAEIVQPNILPLCSLSQWIMMGVVSTLFPVVCGWNQGNPAYAFAIFGCITIVSFFIDRKIVIETKDKTEVEIRKQYDQKFP